MIKFKFQWLLVVGLLFFSVGCSRNYKLSGTVTYSDDGTPIPNATVFFSDGTQESFGVTDKDGKFIVGTLAEDDGLPPGEYKVRITAEEVTIRELPGGGQDNTYENLIDAKYNEWDTSGYTFTSDGSTNTLDLKLDRAK